MEDFSAKMEGIGKTERVGTTYCVTGASGFIGSWLVKTLLQDGYTVRATARDPAKCLYLSSQLGETQRLTLFKADLNEEGSFDEAFHGSNGVFHVAAPMDFTVNHIEDDHNIEKYVRSQIVDPQIKGIENLLKSCLKSRSIKRVVFTSSISTVTARDNDGGWRPFVDENSRTPTDLVWQAKPSGWIYILSKILTEEAAYKFASENGIDLVSMITSTVSGPFLTPRLPLSIRVLLSPITGEGELLSILCSVKERMGSIGMVHSEDVCRAHIFVMEHPRAHGPYICSVDSCTISKLVDLLTRQLPTTSSNRYEDEERGVRVEISSKKLRDLGFEYKHGIEDVIGQTITFCVDNGFLSSSVT